jgi:tetratricopeptide (TPR) repeat protein
MKIRRRTRRPARGAGVAIRSQALAITILTFALTSLALALTALTLAPLSLSGQAAGAAGSPQTVRAEAMEAVEAYVRIVKEARRLEFEDAGRGREPAAGQVAREHRPAAIEALDAAGARAPDDDWIVGHRVGMRIKHGLMEEAREIAESCDASPWWCAALQGFARQQTGRIAEAEEAFERALEAMPSQVWCAWTEEIFMLLEEGLAEEYASLRCVDRAPQMARIWWLADPLYLTEGNERRVEHFARLVALRLHDETLELVNIDCAPEHRRSFLVLGVPEEWWSFEQFFIPFDEATGRRFVPGEGVVRDPWSHRAEDWEHRARSREERYDPGFGPLYGLDQQTAFFVRGDSIEVVAATELGGHPLAVRAPLEVGLALTWGPEEPPRVVRERGDAAGRYLMRTRVADRPQVVSVEAVGEREGAARARFGHTRPAEGAFGVGISDLLLFEWGDGVEQSLEGVAPRMLGSTQVEEGREIGVFWEVYGVVLDQPVEFTVSGVPMEPGLLRRLGQALRVVSPRETMEVSWTEPADQDGRMARTLRLDISQLSEGEYTLEMRARTSGGEPATARRELQVGGG